MSTPVLHHFGVAVSREHLDVDLGRIGAVFESAHVDPKLGVEVVFWKFPKFRLELVCDLLGSETVAPILRRWGSPHLYQVAFECSGGLGQIRARLREVGALELSNNLAAVAFPGRRVSFFHMTDGLILELIHDVEI